MSKTYFFGFDYLFNLIRVGFKTKLENFHFTLILKKHWKSQLFDL